MRAVILIGSPGVGKSTTLTLLADTLEADGIANAVVEVESLARAFPYPPLTQALAALPAIVELHRKAGHDLLLAAATPENQRELDALVDAFWRSGCHRDPSDREVRDRGRAGHSARAAGLVWPSATT
jgi:ATPase subunit of ABC transporter with duplicated ATPase domains